MSGTRSTQQSKKKPVSFYDYTLVFVVLFLCAFGLVMLYSTTAYSDQITYHGNSFYSVVHQAAFVAVSVVVMIIVSKVDYHIWLKFAGLVFIVALVMLVLVQFMGVESHGEKRWLRFGPINIQPAEIMKIAVIMCFPQMINYLYPRLRKEWWPWVALYIFLGIADIGVLISNLSSAIIIAGIGIVILFVTDKRKWPYFVVAALGIGALVFAYQSGLLDKVLKPYQMDRINAWLDPLSDPDDKGYQILQSLYAIGSGGFFGKGLGQSIQKLGYLPEAQNDMIFSIICEELGLFGAFLVILLFSILIWRLMIIANNAPDMRGALMVSGVLGHIALQVIFNLAVATNLMPNTGVGLPFISSGGTAVLCLMIEVGLVLSVSNQIRLTDQ